MALSLPNDPLGLPYPGAVPVDPYDWNADHEDLYQQAMAGMVPASITPAAPVPYPEPEPVPPADTLAFRVRPIGDAGGTKGSQRIGEAGAPGANEIAAPADEVTANVEAANTVPDAPGAAWYLNEPGYIASRNAADARDGTSPSEEELRARAYRPGAPYGVPVEPEAAAPPPLEVDAISGGYTKPQAHRIVGWTDARGATAAAPEMPEEYATDEELQDIVLGETSKQNVRRQIRDAEDKANEQRERERLADRKFQDLSDREYEARQKARAEARAEREARAVRAKELANTKIDRGRWWHSRSTAEKIAGIIGAMAGGLTAPYRGGRNDGIAMLMKAVDDDVADQKAEIASKREALADEGRTAEQRYADDENDYREAELRRQAGYQRVRNEIVTDMQQYNQRGAKAQMYRDAILGIDAKAKAADDAAEAAATKRKIDLAKLGLDVEAAQLARDKFNADRADKQAKAGKVKEVDPLDVQRSAADLQSLNIKVPNFAGTLSIKQAKGLLEAGKSSEEYEKAARENKAENVAIADILLDNGEQARFKDPIAVGKSKGQAEQAVTLIDELARLVAQNGFESDVLKSPEWVKAKGALAELLLTSKNVDQLGVLSGDDIRLEMEKITGGLDPTGMRSAIVGLMAGRDRLVNKLNFEMKNNAILPPGRSLKRWEPADLYHLPKADALIQGKTAVERGSEAKRGTAGEKVQQVLYGVDNEEAVAKATEEARAERAPSGLEKADARRVGELVRTAGSSKPGDALQRIVDAASTTIRPDVSRAVLAQVRDENRAIYDQVVARLPEEIRANLPPEVGEAEARKLEIGSPQYKWETMEPAALAERMKDDASLANRIIDYADHGTKRDKAKALEILRLRYQRKAE